MALRHDPFLAIDRTAKAHANGADIELLEQFATNLLDLRQNPFGAAARVDLPPGKRHQLPPAAVAHSQLELGTANFNT